MANLKTIIEDYGADYESIMVRFMSNEKLYMRILAMLPHDESLQKLEKSLRDEDYFAAFEAAHTLKGLSANLGLTPLYNNVCSIVEPLRKGENRGDYSELYECIRKEFYRAVKLLELLKEED